MEIHQVVFLSVEMITSTDPYRCWEVSFENVLISVAQQHVVSHFFSCFQDLSIIIDLMSTLSN